MANQRSTNPADWQDDAICHIHDVKKGNDGKCWNCEAAKAKTAAPATQPAGAPTPVATGGRK